MAGAGYETGLGVASYEWTAAVMIVLVGIFLLPKFLRSGIYTIPEYLEYRYSSGARGLMALYMMVAYIFVIISAVLYAGAIGLEAVFGQTIKDYVQTQTNLDMEGMLGPNWFMILAVWLIGIIAGLYTVWGGLKAVVWADLFNGLGLIAGGILATFLGFKALGALKGGGADLAWYDQISHGVSYFFQNAGEKLSAVKPFSDPEVPWVAVFIGGLWIPQFFYWGLNQFISQRALGARSVSEGQKGMMLAASLKLLMPFIIIFPGIMAFELYAEQIANKDSAYPHMLQQILPAGIRGLMFAALFGAVMSSLDSMLNSASTILTMDLYKRHLKKEASEKSLMRLGQVMTALFVIIACAWAPTLGWIGGGRGVFDYIQKTWGFVTPGVVTVFFFGMISKRTPAQAATGALLLGPPIYASCLYWMPGVAFLHHMAFTFIILSVYTFVVTMLTPLGDADETTESGDQRPTGFLRQKAIPFLTTAAGGFLLGWPMLHFTFTTSWQLFDLPEWANFIPPGGAIAAYVILAIYVLRLPTPAARRVTGEVRKRSGAKALGRTLGYGLAGLLAAVVVGLHAYLFAAWIIPADVETREPFWRRAYAVTVPQLSIADGGISVKGSFQVEKTFNEGPQKAAAPESGDVAPMGQEPGPGEMDPMGQGPGPGKPKPGKPEVDDEARDGDGEDPAEEKAAADDKKKDDAEEDDKEGEEPEAAGAEDAGEESGPVMVLLGPLVIGLVAAVLSLIAVCTLWRQPASAEQQFPVTEKIDLRPSGIVKLWGLLIIAATVALYIWFF